MARTPKLNDIQLILLATAVQRPDGSLLPPPASLADQGVRIRKAVPPLIRRKLAEEMEVTDRDRSWYEDGERRVGLVITAAGRAIIAVEEPSAEPAVALEPGQDPTPSISADSTPAAPPPIVAGSKIAQATDTPPAEPRRTKSALVLSLLGREQGATLAELVEATGWLPLTTRAALTGLKKKGHAVIKSKRDQETCYHLASA